MEILHLTYPTLKKASTSLICFPRSSCHFAELAAGIVLSGLACILWLGMNQTVKHKARVKFVTVIPHHCRIK